MSNPFGGKASPGKSSEVVPAGSHPAALVALVDLGLHEEIYRDEQKGERKAKVHKVMLVWELVMEPIAGLTGENHLQARDYTLAFSPKAALRKMLVSWRGKDFADGEEIDLMKVLGQKCLVTVSHKKAASSGNNYAKLESIAPLPKAMKASSPEPKHKPVAVTLDMPLPDWIPYLYGEPVKDVIARRLPEEEDAAGATADVVANGDGKGDAYEGEQEIPF